MVISAKLLVQIFTNLSSHHSQFHSYGSEFLLLRNINLALSHKQCFTYEFHMKIYCISLNTSRIRIEAAVGRAIFARNKNCPLIDLSPLSSGDLIALIKLDVTTGYQLNDHFIAKHMVVNEDVHVANFHTSFASKLYC